MKLHQIQSQYSTNNSNQNFGLRIDNSANFRLKEAIRKRTILGDVRNLRKRINRIGKDEVFDAFCCCKSKKHQGYSVAVFVKNYKQNRYGVAFADYRNTPNPKDIISVCVNALKELRKNKPFKIYKPFNPFKRH